MNVFGKIVNETRIAEGITLNETSNALKIDTAVLSKIEKGRRVATKEQVQKLIDFFSIDRKKAITAWLSDKILSELQYEEYGFEALKVAEERVTYQTLSSKRAALSLSDRLRKTMHEIDTLLDSWKKSKPLDGLHLEKLKEYFSIQYTYDSNRIEGNTLTMQETHLVIKEGLTIGGKSVREHLEAINHFEAGEYLYDLITQRLPISEKVLKDLHFLVLKGIDTKYAGKYRDVPVYISGSEHVPCQPYLVQKNMEDVFVFYDENKSILHPVILAAEMHERIVSVHPFIDGNGRTSRLMMNLILLQNGFPIANIKGDNESRLKYYKSLESCHSSGKHDFYDLIASVVKESLTKHLRMVE